MNFRIWIKYEQINALNYFLKSRSTEETQEEEAAKDPPAEDVQTVTEGDAQIPPEESPKVFLFWKVLNIFLVHRIDFGVNN